MNIAGKSFVHYISSISQMVCASVDKKKKTEVYIIIYKFS